jgi:cytochrome c oxidase subunit 2
MATFATVVFVVVVALSLYALRRPARKFSEEREWRLQRFWLVGGGVLLPTVSIALLLIFGIPLGHRMLPLPPEDGEAFAIHVTGHQWWWQVRYPDTDIELRDELYIPVGVPIDVHLSTEDVIHSFWVPRLGGKLDTIPGRTNVLRLQADQPGEYRGQCAEFCGLNHAHMRFVVTALPEEEFATWLEGAQTDD